MRHVSSGRLTRHHLIVLSAAGDAPAVPLLSTASFAVYGYGHRRRHDLPCNGESGLRRARVRCPGRQIR